MLTRIYEHCSVGNLAHIHFAANIFSLPLKSADHPHGIYTEYEMYQLMALMFICIFFDLDVAKSFALRLAAKKLVGQLSKVVEMNVRAVNMTGWIAGIVDGKTQNKHYLTDYGVHMVRQLLATGMTVEEVTYSQIMPTAGAMVANQAQVVCFASGFSGAEGWLTCYRQFTQALDFYLSDRGKQYLPDINRLAKMNTPEADEKILHYAMEGIRTSTFPPQPCSPVFSNPVLRRAKRHIRAVPSSDDRHQSRRWHKDSADLCQRSRIRVLRVGGARPCGLPRP
jgi:linoleate 10R-lipoxygenase